MSFVVNVLVVSWGGSVSLTLRGLHHGACAIVVHHLIHFILGCVGVKPALIPSLHLVYLFGLGGHNVVGHLLNLVTLRGILGLFSHLDGALMMHHHRRNEFLIKAVPGFIIQLFHHIVHTHIHSDLLVATHHLHHIAYARTFMVGGKVKTRDQYR